jgi:serine/threonine-protein kinase
MAGQPHNLPFSEVDAFTLQELIYEGPHTLVFKGYQSSLERVLIIKLLKPHVQNREEWVERFRREARACAKLKHPNIVDVYALGEKNGYHYIAIEYVDGLSLKDLLKTSGSLPLNIALYVTHQILQALSFVHQHQIIHRDVKPGNILINSQGQAKLTDFGLAQIEEEPTVTQQGSIIGTPAYMPPEQIMGSTLDGRADLFALGAVLYEMLSGQQAFAGENYSTCLYKIVNEQPPVLTQLQSKLPEDIASYQEKFLRKSPEERWRDAATALQNLQSLIKQLDIDIGPEQVAGFIRPLLPESPTKVRKRDACRVAVPGDEKSFANEQQRNRKRRWLMIGGLGAVAVFILFMWMQMTPGSPIHNEDASKITPLLSSDSVYNDSSAASKTSIDSAAVSASQKDGEKDHNIRSGNQISQPSIVATLRDTLPGESSTNHVTLTDSLPTASKTEAFPASQLEIRVEPWAKIVIDGREADSHAVRQYIAIEPGKHTVSFLHPNFSPQVFQVEVQPGEQKSLQWSFLENAGYLWVEARPWADIFVDDKFRDTTPLDKPLVLSTGGHLLELKHPALSTYREHIKIQAGDTLQVHVTLKSN